MWFTKSNTSVSSSKQNRSEDEDDLDDNDDRYRSEQRHQGFHPGNNDDHYYCNNPSLPHGAGYFRRPNIGVSEVVPNGSSTSNRQVPVSLYNNPFEKGDSSPTPLTPKSRCTPLSYKDYENSWSNSVRNNSIWNVAAGIPSLSSSSYFASYNMRHNVNYYGEGPKNGGAVPHPWGVTSDMNGGIGTPSPHRKRKKSSNNSGVLTITPMRLRLAVGTLLFTTTIMTVTVTRMMTVYPPLDHIGLDHGLRAVEDKVGRVAQHVENLVLLHQRPNGNNESFFSQINNVDTLKDTLEQQTFQEQDQELSALEDISNEKARDVLGEDEHAGVEVENPSNEGWGVNRADAIEVPEWKRQEDSTEEVESPSLYQKPYNLGLSGGYESSGSIADFSVNAVNSESDVDNADQWSNSNLNLGNTFQQNLQHEEVDVDDKDNNVGYPRKTYLQDSSHFEMKSDNEEEESISNGNSIYARTNRYNEIHSDGEDETSNARKKYVRVKRSAKQSENVEANTNYGVDRSNNKYSYDQTNRVEGYSGSSLYNNDGRNTDRFHNGVDTYDVHDQNGDEDRYKHQDDVENGNYKRLNYPNSIHDGNRRPYLQDEVENDPMYNRGVVRESNGERTTFDRADQWAPLEDKKYRSEYLTEERNTKLERVDAVYGQKRYSEEDGDNRNRFGRTYKTSFLGKKWASNRGQQQDRDAGDQGRDYDYSAKRTVDQNGRYNDRDVSKDTEYEYVQPRKSLYSSQVERGRSGYEDKYKQNESVGRYDNSMHMENQKFDNSKNYESHLDNEYNTNNQREINQDVNFANNDQNLRMYQSVDTAGRDEKDLIGTGLEPLKDPYSSRSNTNLNWQPTDSKRDTSSFGQPMLIEEQDSPQLQRNDEHDQYHRDHLDSFQEQLNGAKILSTSYGEASSPLSLNNGLTTTTTATAKRSFGSSLFDLIRPKPKLPSVTTNEGQTIDTTASYEVGMKSEGLLGEYQKKNSDNQAPPPFW